LKSMELKPLKVMGEPMMCVIAHAKFTPAKNCEGL
jgi:hypothetical protein